MNKLRFQILRAKLVLILNTAKPYFLEEEELFTTLTNITQPEITRAEFDSVLRKMDTARQLTRGEIEGVRKLKLSETGELELLK